MRYDILTFNTKKIAKRSKISHFMVSGASVPSGVRALYGSEVQEAIFTMLTVFVHDDALHVFVGVVVYLRDVLHPVRQTWRVGIYLTMQTDGHAFDDGRAETRQSRQDE